MNSGGLTGEFFHQLLDWVYPASCAVCGDALRKTSAICSLCVERLVRLPRPLCPDCGGAVSGAAAVKEACETCGNEPWAFDFARSAFIYHAELRDLVLTFKYRGGLYLGSSLADLMAPMREEYADRLKGVSWTLVPVPLSRRKLRVRGFNQAEELARILSERWNAPVINALDRRNDRISQTALDRDGRRGHVSGLYRAREKCRHEGLLEGKDVLLIDDLFTTGSTAQACASILKRELRSASVGVLTLARSIPWHLMPESLKSGNSRGMDWG